MNITLTDKNKNLIVWAFAIPMLFRRFNKHLNYEENKSYYSNICVFRKNFVI